MARQPYDRALESRNARINIRVSDDLRVALADLARSDQRSLSAYVERVLAEHAQAKGAKPQRRK